MPNAVLISVSRLVFKTMYGALDFVNEQGQKTEMTEVRQRTSTSTQVQEFDHLEEGVASVISFGDEYHHNEHCVFLNCIM